MLSNINSSSGVWRAEGGGGSAHAEDRRIGYQFNVRRGRERVNLVVIMMLPLPRTTPRCRRGSSLHVLDLEFQRAAVLSYVIVIQ